MKKKLSGDLSKLTNVPEEILDKLLNVCKYCISESIYESMLNKDKITEIDLGFGDLLFKTGLKDLKIKFIPKEDLELDIKGVTNGDKSTLHRKLEKALSTKLTEIYKDIL